MEFRSLAIAGFGDIGERLTRRLHPQRWRCHGLRRNAHAVPAGVRGVAVDLAEPESLQILETIAPDALVVTLSPADRSEAGYRAGFAGAMESIIQGLGAHRPTSAFFVSSTRVYREANGGWIDEDSPVAVGDAFAGAILDAESMFLDAIEGGVVLRAGGLYGHGPGPLLKKVAAGRLSPSTPLRYGNRMHRDDVAGFIAWLLGSALDIVLDSAPDSAEGHRVINLVDDNPAAIQDVEAWLCEGLGRPYEPPEPDPAAPSPSHKRIRNERLKASGYTLEYPDFRAGYRDVLHRWMAHSEREDGLDLH